MKAKKIVSLVTTAALVLGLAGVFPSQSVLATETPVYNGFDADYDGWYGVGENAAADALAGGYKSPRAMFVTGREIPSDGAEAQKGFYLDGGVKYTYSVYVKAETAETFTLSLRYIYTDTEVFETKTVAEVKAEAGEWTLLRGSFKAPKNAVNLSPIITTETANDFRFDEFSAKAKILTNPAAAEAAKDGAKLKDVYAKYFRVGTCVSATNGSQPLSNSTTQAIILKQFNSITPENELKPDQIIQQSGSTDTDVKVSLSRAATIIDFCVKNNIAMRGHTLVWYSQTPQWFFSENFNGNTAVSTAVMDRRMESFIKNTFNALKTQYPSLNLYAYDVVNEAFKDGGDTKDWTKLTRDANNSGWVKVYGDNSFIPKAFDYAKKYRDQYWPDMKLYYNDYNEYESPKQDAMVSLVAELYKKGTLDGVGMQSHLATNYPSTSRYNSAMDAYLAIGCDVQITELDITGSPSSTTSTMFKSILQHAVEAKKQGKPISAVVVWGTTNKSSWRADKGDTVLLLDNDGNPNVNYQAIGGGAIVPQADWGDGDAANIGEGGSAAEKPKPDANGFFFYDPFETDNGMWVSRGDDVKLTVSKSEKYAGTSSLSVTGRKNNWNGAQRELSTYTFEPGGTYSFGGAVKSSASGQVKLSLQYNDGGTEKYADIAKATAAKGEWTILENKSYKLPAGASAMMMYFEAEDASADLYVDEAFGGVEGASAFGGTVVTTTGGGNVTTGGGNVTTTTPRPADGKVITQNETGTYNGYDYEFWTDVPAGSSSNKAKMTLTGVPGTGGSFKSEYDTTNSKNTLMRTGKRFGDPKAAGKSWKEIGDIIQNYDVDYNPGNSGASYMCAYGWTRDDNGAPLVEYYVVESWGAWRPPGEGSKGKVTIDGVEYEIFETTRTNQPSIVGNTTFKQYWSVRTSKNPAGANGNIKGTINLSKHFKAWEDKGLKMGSLYEVSLCIEGYNSTGTATINKHIVTIDGVDVGGASASTTTTPAPTTTTTTRTSTTTGTSTTTTRTSTTTTVTTAKPGETNGLGDLNGDGRIGTADLILLAKHCQSSQLTNAQISKADCNLDGVADSVDLLILIKYLLGDITDLPVLSAAS